MLLNILLVCLKITLSCTAFNLGMVDLLPTIFLYNSLTVSLFWSIILDVTGIVSLTDFIVANLTDLATLAT